MTFQKITNFLNPYIDTKVPLEIVVQKINLESYAMDVYVNVPVQYSRYRKLISPWRILLNTKDTKDLQTMLQEGKKAEFNGELHVKGFRLLKRYEGELTGNLKIDEHSYNITLASTYSSSKPQLKNIKYQPSA